MPNGFHGSKAEWERLVAPLRDVDARLRAFATAHGARVVENARAWPSRSIDWRGGPVERSVSIALEDEKRGTWGMGAVAWLDRDGKRYWRRASIVRGAAWPDIRDRLEDLLAQGFALAESWREDDLEYATDVSDP
jgi:hypothetical protein